MKNLALLFSLCIGLVVISCSSDDEYVPVDDQDTVSPSAPLNLIASNTTETSIDLSWDESTDNVGVLGYKVYQDGIEIETNITNTYITVNNLTAESTYSFNVRAFDAAGNISQDSNTVEITTLDLPFGFRDTLSEMDIYTETMWDLNPLTNVQLYEINTTLFTDYALKQRLIKLPEGTSLQFAGDDLLPDFPNETMIVKTFYYNIDDRNPALGKKIIESRVLLKIDDSWQVGNYKWNESQTEAFYTENSAEIAISYIDQQGDNQNVDYVIPSKTDCFTCHNNNNTPIPIGLKLRSLNFTPSYSNINQLDLFISTGLIEGISSANQIGILPDWTDDANYTIFERGRAYIDVNCAHCHQPGSTTPIQFDMDFRLETPYADTKIYEKRSSIEARFSTVIAGYSMPLIGRTIVHEEALTMLMDYLSQIQEP